MKPSDAPAPLLREAIRHLESLRELGVAELRLGRGSAAAASSPPPGKAGAGEGRPPGTLGRSPATGDHREGTEHGAGPAAGANAPVLRSFLQDDLFGERIDASEEGPPRARLETLRKDEIGECVRCRLAGGRTTIVFGSGNPEADLMFVGEGPGADEDAQGLPFVGRAGRLLTKMIGSMAVGGRRLGRDDVYIANIIKCRPPGNRDPEPDEIAACEGFLFKQIAIIRPKIIVALGAFAARTLLRSNAPISALRGRFHEYRGTLLMPTFHPAYILRNYTEETRRTVYEDLKMACAELERMIAAP